MSIAGQLLGYRTLVDALRAAPRSQPFLTMWNPGEARAEKRVTFGEFFEIANSYAALYRNHDLGPRDTVILIMPQGIPLVAAFIGALVSGVVPAILAYPNFKADPVKYRFGLEGVTRNLSARLTVLDGEFPEELMACIGGTDAVRFDPASEPGVSSGELWCDPEPDDIAFIQHSAGTTGLQKGVALAHGAVLRQLIALAESLELSSQDKIASWLPLYHDMGLIACLVLPSVAHLPVVMESPTDWVMNPGSFLRLSSDERCTLCWLPNFSYQFMARRVGEEERQGLDLSALRAAINCSEPVSNESMEEFWSTYQGYGLRRSALQSSYAMAEATFAVTQSIPGVDGFPTTVYGDREAVSKESRLRQVKGSDPQARAFVSSGRCLAGTRVRILNDEGHTLPDGSIGEIHVQSDSLFTGYYNRPDLTEQALSGDWYRTRDLGFLWNSELYVLGRKDDLVIVGGKNIYPQDIEEIASSHPDIRDGRAVACGVYNAELGTQDLIVIAEVRDDEVWQRHEEIALEIRQRILSEIGVPPRIVHVVPPRWVVKSTAGKPARSTNRKKLFQERPELEPPSEAQRRAVGI